MSSNFITIPYTEYPGTHEYLQAVLNRMGSKNDYTQLLIYLSQLKTYMITHDANTMKLETLRDRFLLVMLEADRMKEVLKADEPVKNAHLAFRDEVLTLLGLLKLRDDEAKPWTEKEEMNTRRWLAAIAGGVSLTVGAAVAGPALAVGALNLIGFGSAGPVAGSIAAAIQSVVYGGAVTSGSIFALCQSAAMAGSSAEIAAGIAALGAAGAGLLGGFGGPDNNDGDDAGSNEAGPNNVQVLSN